MLINQTTQIPILLKMSDWNSNSTPHYFVKWSTDDKHYRVSTSFKFLNKKYNLKINIVRNFSHLGVLNIEFLYNLFEEQRLTLRKINYDNKDHNLGFYHFIDPENKGEIFLFERRFGEDFNRTLVFFSLQFWNVNEYLEILREQKVQK
jgi:hypothetical protein